MESTDVADTGEYDLSTMSTHPKLIFKDEHTRQLLARLIIDRRTLLDLSQAELTRAGGPGTTIIGELERGILDSLAWRTVHKLERALGWKRNSIEFFVAKGNVPELSVEGVVKETESFKIKELEDQIAVLHKRVAEIERASALVAEAWKKAVIGKGS